jgi:hypothetical protein
VSTVVEVFDGRRLSPLGLFQPGLQATILAGAEPAIEQEPRRSSKLQV